MIAHSLKNSFRTFAALTSVGVEVVRAAILAASTTNVACFAADMRTMTMLYTTGSKCVQVFFIAAYCASELIFAWRPCRCIFPPLFEIVYISVPSEY